MDGSRALRVDAALYGGSAVVALATSRLAAIPQYREWGRIAVLPYLVAAAAAAILSLRRRGAGRRGRAVIAAAAVIGGALLPMSLEVVWRSHTAPGFHAQSEVIVTEEAAKALLHGRDPYAAVFVHGPLAARPIGTKTHYPYLPGMVAFGVPRAADGTSPWSDARVWFAAATLGVAAVAFRRVGWRGGRSLTAFIVLVAVPPGALLMATGGDDLPALALLLMAFVMTDQERPLGAGVAAGLAAALKQTAWPVLPFLLLGSRDREGRPAWGRTAVAIGAMVLPLVVAFGLWNPPAFVEDAVKFPLGLGRQRSAAGSATLGGLILRTFPGARGALTALLVLAMVAASVILVAYRRPRSPRAAWCASRAGLLFVVAALLAPAARVGYAAYPLNLLVWAWLLGPMREGEPTDRAAGLRRTLEARRSARGPG